MLEEGGWGYSSSRQGGGRRKGGVSSVCNAKDSFDNCC